MKRKFFNMLLLATAWLQFFVGCAYRTTYTYKAEARVEKPSGIYVGALSYASDIKSITGSKPVFLNEESGLFLLRAIANSNIGSGRASVSQSNAVEQAVSAINSQSYYFPDVESVDIVVITDKEASLPAEKAKALGKDVNVHYFNADKEIGDIVDIAIKFTEAFKKSSIVYLVLDAAPKYESNAVKIQYSAVAVLDALSEKVDNVPTPLVKVFVDEKNPKSTTKIDWFKTSMYWTGIVCVSALVALVVVLVANAEPSSEESY